MKKIFLLSALFAYQASYAALPPLWQDVAELKAILDDKQLGDHLQSGEAIEAILKEEEGWTIRTNKSELSIKVISEPQNRPGPTRFILKFND